MHKLANVFLSKQQKHELVIFYAQIFLSCIQIIVKLKESLFLAITFVQTSVLKEKKTKIVKFHQNHEKTHW